jgi:hypothetical protein
VGREIHSSITAAAGRGGRNAKAQAQESLLEALTEHYDIPVTRQDYQLAYLRQPPDVLGDQEQDLPEHVGEPGRNLSPASPDHKPAREGDGPRVGRCATVAHRVLRARRGLPAWCFSAEHRFPLHRERSWATLS